MSEFFKDGKAEVGGKATAFKRREIRGGYLMWLPESFCEDAAIVSNYSYFFSKDKSPLSIAVKFSPTTALADKAKMLESYFSQPPKAAGEDERIHYRETVTLSQYMSVYSLRFSKDAGEGMLFGCFNCSADYSSDWKPVVLEILRSVEKN
jgi:hypothetical protein